MLLNYNYECINVTGQDTRETSISSFFVSEFNNKLSCYFHVMSNVPLLFLLNNSETLLHCFALIKHAVRKANPFTFWEMAVKHSLHSPKRLIHLWIEYLRTSYSTRKTTFQNKLYQGGHLVPGWDIETHWQDTFLLGLWIVSNVYKGMVLCCVYHHFRHQRQMHPYPMC